MQIITVPHPGLRETAVTVDTVSNAFKKFVKDLELTLDSARKPRGVGLAATQVNKPYRAFAIAVDEHQTLINPRMTAHSSKQTLGKNGDEPVLEGCLSIPRIFGPVPRWEWVELEYQLLIEDELVKKSGRFDDFSARVVQHELDHLDGILFTDYTLEYELPVYQENAKSGQLEEIDYTLLKLW